MSLAAASFRSAVAPSALALFLAPVPAAAQEPAPAGHSPSAVGEPTHAEELQESTHEHHLRNEVALVLGGTWESEEDETFFTVGAEYERSFGRPFGFSVVLEHINEIDAWVLAVPLDIRPVAGLKFIAGPGVEFKPRRPGVREEAGGEVHAEEPGEPVEPGGRDEDLFLWRLGVAYSWELGKGFVVTPAVDYDLVREEGRWVEAVVFDVALGIAF